MLSRIIVKIIVGVMFLNFNNVLEAISGIMLIPQNIGSSPIQQANLNIISRVSEMLHIIGYSGYVMGLIFFIQAAIEFKKFNEGMPEKVMDFIADVKIHEKVDIKKEKIDIEDKDLNRIMNEIIAKNNYLKNHDLVKENIEYIHMIENTESKYLPNIYNNFIVIPKEKRNQIHNKNNPYILTLNQLNLLLNGLIVIEDNILEKTIMNQKVNEIFLKEKMGSI